uniref:CRAL-TRIO domain-containing protein n=1 Tax=Meloidogyne incognita TaxID=6306 RepID=A0A914LZV7_MELIC
MCWSVQDRIAELRKCLGEQLLQDTPLFNDNFSLLRWLHGWNNRFDEIVPRFKRASQVFRSMRINEMFFDDIDTLNGFTRQLTSAADYYPGGALGYDKEGNLLALQTMGRSHPKQLARCGRVSDVYRLCVLIQLQERKLQRKLGLCVIIDLEGFNSDHLTTIGLKVYAALLKELQDLFPDMLRQIYVINAHYLVKTAYAIIKPVLSEQSREKVIFLDSSYHEQLAEGVGRENLFRRWGGIRQPLNGDPEWGTLRIGGLPPKGMRYSAATNPQHVPEGQLTKLIVPARQRRIVDISVPAQPGFPQQTLHWFWISSSDVDFGVINEEEQELWPIYRILTDYVPEFGSLLVETGRNYKLCFDNTFSLFTKKEIKYSYKLVPVENTTRKENDEVKIKNVTKLEEEKENKRQIIS